MSASQGKQFVVFLLWSKLWMDQPFPFPALLSRQQSLIPLRYCVWLICIFCSIWKLYLVELQNFPQVQQICPATGNPLCARWEKPLHEIQLQHGRCDGDEHGFQRCTECLGLPWEGLRRYGHNQYLRLDSLFCLRSTKLACSICFLIEVSMNEDPNNVLISGYEPR